MSDPFSPERKTARLKKQNLFGSGYAGLGTFHTVTSTQSDGAKGWRTTSSSHRKAMITPNEKVYLIARNPINFLIISRTPSSDM